MAKGAGAGCLGSLFIPWRAIREWNSAGTSVLLHLLHSCCRSDGSPPWIIMYCLYVIKEDLGGGWSVSGGGGTAKQ